MNQFANKTPLNCISNIVASRRLIQCARYWGAILTFFLITLLFNIQMTKAKFAEDGKLIFIPSIITLQKDVKQTFDVTGDTKPNAEYKIENCKDNCFIEITRENDNGTKIGLKLTKEIFTPTDISKELTIIQTIVDGTKSVGKIILKVPANISFPSQIGITLIEGDKTFSIANLLEVTRRSDNTKIEGLGSTKDRLESSNQDVLKIEDNGTLNPIKPGQSTLKIKTNNHPLSEAKEVLVTIDKAIMSLGLVGGNVEVYGGETKTLDFFANGDANSKINVERIRCSTSDERLVTVFLEDGKYKLKAGVINAQEPQVNLSCELREPKGRESSNKFEAFKIFTRERKGYFEIESINGNLLFPNKSLTFFVKVFELNGNPAQAGIRYELEKSEHNKWVTLSPAGQRLIVSWVNTTDPKDALKPPSAIVVKISAKIANGGGEVFYNLPIRLVSVGKFAPLKVKINVMDNRTVSDLYGDVTSDEYHVLMVRLFNDLKKEDTEGDGGESILAYSSSMEIAVALEKQFHGDSESAFAGGRIDKSDDIKDAFKEITEETAVENVELLKEHLTEVRGRYRILLNELRKLMKDAGERDAEAIRLETIAKNDPTEPNIKEAKKARTEAEQVLELVKAKNREIRRLVRSAMPPMPSVSLPNNLAIKDGKWYPATRDDLVEADEQTLLLRDNEVDSPVSTKDNEPNCVDTITYRPLTFEMMVNTVDRRDGRTFRSRAFRILNLVGTTASAITAVAVPSPRSDLPLGLEKYGNVLIPGLEKIFPNLKEQHRQNIVSQAMKPIEEVAFGEDINRVLFVPKKDIRGLIRGHNARISTICPFYFKVKVAVVTKGGEVVLDGQ